MSYKEKSEAFDKHLEQFPLVRVRFVDHARCGGDLVELGHCEIIGRLLSEDKYHYTIATWIFDTVKDEHTDVYSIAKTKGCKLWRLK